MEKQKRKWGDRRDARRVRNLDAMHAFVPYIIPNRADNEALLNDNIDMTAALEYLKKKNAESDDEYKYTAFHLIVAALAKTIYLRPKMNRFIQGHRIYERNDISFSFVIKKKFTDDGAESLAIVKIKNEEESPLAELHRKVRKKVYKVRVKDKNDGTTDIMAKFIKLPRFMLRIAIRILRWLDYHGWSPKSFMEEDPYYSTAFVSNLGSIKMNANYHHLTNYGTNSIFVTIGRIKKTPVFKEDGSFEMRDTVDIGLTIDERIADGVYYAKTVKMLEHLLTHPELLDEPLKNSVEGVGDCGAPREVKPKACKVIKEQTKEELTESADRLDKEVAATANE